MVRWRYCLFLTVLLLLPLKTGSKSEDDDEEERNEEDDNEEDSEDDDGDEDSASEKSESILRRAPNLQVTRTMPVSRTTKKRPLECYVCAFKSDTPQLRSCLDPAKYRVHTITCHNVDDKCFTSVMAKGHSYETVVRGCRSGCLGSPETTCCELNRCNNQAFAMPSAVETRALVHNKATKSFPSSVVFFVTILLVLQTVVKVTFV